MDVLDVWMLGTHYDRAQDDSGLIGYPMPLYRIQYAQPPPAFARPEVHPRYRLRQTVGQLPRPRPSVS